MKPPDYSHRLLTLTPPLVLLLPAVCLWAGGYVYAAIVSGTLAGAVVVIAAARMAKASAAASASRFDDLRHPVCENCLYSLIGLADNGACPECGEAYDLKPPNRYRRSRGQRRIPNDVDLPCPQCGYNLRGLIDRGHRGRSGTGAKCPECGKDSELSELYVAREHENRWRRGLVTAGLIIFSFGLLAPVVFMLAGQIILGWNRASLLMELAVLLAGFGCLGLAGLSIGNRLQRAGAVSGSLTPWFIVLLAALANVVLITQVLRI